MADEIKGLGDMVSRVTKAVGIKECGGCAKRRELLNKAFPLGQQKPTVRTVTPVNNPTWVDGHVPEGWRLVMGPCEVNEHKFVTMYTNGNTYIIWDVIEGRYKNSHTFCCGAQTQSVGVFQSRCQQK